MTRFVKSVACTWTSPPVSCAITSKIVGWSRLSSSVPGWLIASLLGIGGFVSGVLVAYFHGWGSSWFATSASPWLWSLFTFAPDISYVAPLPLLVKIHIVNAFALIAFFPFTRLVHVLVIPNMYLWRKPQVVIWNRGGPAARRGDR